MRRAWQVFIAPDADAAASLPVAASPWHSGRETRIPREHWELVLDFGAGFDPDQAQALRDMSWSRAPDSTVQVSTDALRSAAAFLERLQAAVLKAEPLVPVATEDIPDEYENEEHARMLAAVDAVLRESLRTGQPFKAWVE
jgi:hypothetical protein